MISLFSLGLLGCDYFSKDAEKKEPAKQGVKALDKKAGKPKAKPKTTPAKAKADAKKALEKKAIEKKELEKKEIEKKELKNEKPDGEDALDGPGEAQKMVEKPKVKPEAKKEPKAEQWKPAVLQVVTNFDKADVTVNGQPYPEYTGGPTEDGMILPAGGPYRVQVTYEGKLKHYTINLRPYETRLLIVELTGFQGGAAPPKEEKKTAKVEKKPVPKTAAEKKKEGQPGRVTVYSKPPGAIMIDGAKSAEKTPGTVDVENGRHEIQVEYESGEVSEKKIVRVRDGSRIKLFFRERKK